MCLGAVWGALGDFFAVPWDALGVPWAPLVLQMVKWLKKQSKKTFLKDGRVQRRGSKSAQGILLRSTGSLQCLLGQFGVPWGPLRGALGCSWGPLATLGAPNG